MLKNLKLILLGMLCISCGDREPPTLKIDHTDSDMESGYRASVEDWNRFLTCWESEMITNLKSQSNLSTTEERLALERGKLGYDGASGGTIQMLQEKLGMQLPASFRHFLTASNGWIQVKFDAGDTNILNANDINFLSIREPEIISDWISIDSSTDSLDVDYLDYSPSQDPMSMRNHYLETAIAISNSADAGIYLLNPDVTTSDGEWEAWFFGWNLPGAIRFPSFEELMKYAYIKALHEPDGDFFFPNSYYENTCAENLPVNRY